MLKKESRMKKIIYAISAFLLLSGCNYLDFDETSGVYEHEDMYENFNRTKQMLTNVYRYIPQDLGVLGNAMRDCGSDDAEFADPDNVVQYFNNGSWSPISVVDARWDNLYMGIRCANEFIESVADVDFSMYESNPQYQNWMKQLQYFPYEARMLRAWFLFELARRYGDIPMPLEMLTIDNANTIQKTAFDDVVNFIVKECDECAQNLPLDYSSVPNNEYGRITKGFAMAIKSKALLYAASRLHNPSMDKDKWKTSAKAALDIINLGQYQLDPGDKVNNTESPENVLIRMNSNSSAFELNNFPVRFTEGNRNYISGTYPTQELVDAFQTVNGYDVILTGDGFVSEDPLFDPTHPYDNRDPRFAKTILANGMPFKGSTIEVWPGGADYSSTLDEGTPTGYFLRKYIIEETSFTPEALVTDKHHWVIYRYAETLLTYAESMVEAFDDPDYTDSDFTISARAALNMVRANAGMPALEVSGKDTFIDALRREWRVEFAFEDHRFWDVRRWCIGADTQTEVSGVSVIRESDGAFSYSRFRYETRVWNERMNLYPIPQEELFCNPNLNPQNAGW